MSTNAEELPQILYNLATKFIHDHPEVAARAATSVARKLVAAGWKIDLSDPDDMDTGLGVGVVLGSIVMFLHYNPEVQADFDGFDDASDESDDQLGEQDLSKLG